MTDLRDVSEMLGIPGMNFPDETLSGEVDLERGEPYTPDEVTESIESLRSKLGKQSSDSLEYIDETVAALMREEKAKATGLGEGEKTPGELFRQMTPAQKAALLATYHVKTLTGVSTNHPLWINKEAVPENVSLHWLSPKVTASLGMRGYRRVPLTPETQKWAPNARQLGSAKWITHANYVLCAIDADVALEAEVLRHRRTNDILEEHDERFRSALRSVAGLTGMRREQAEKLDRAGRGIIATRGYDPDVGRQVRERPGTAPVRDLVHGENE